MDNAVKNGERKQYNARFVVDIHTYSIGAAAVTTVRNRRQSKSGPEKPIVMV